jgi:AraC family transcriptional regulator
MDAQCNASLSNVVPAHLPIDPILVEAGDAGRLSLHQLQSAIADISRALNEALRDDRTNAVLYLRRAENSLRPAAQSSVSRSVNPGPRLTAWQRRRVLEHIETRLAAPLRNRELAALVDYSEFHFNVAFRNTLGTSPHEFLIRRRIERAQQLMLSTDMPLCDIAAECGLADQAHLSRLFRKVVGESPAAWRRSRVSEAVGPSGGAARRSETRSDESHLRISRVGS